MRKMYVVERNSEKSYAIIRTVTHSAGRKENNLCLS